MARPLKFSNRRMIRLTEYADLALIKIAHKFGRTPTEQARTYVEDGIRRDTAELKVGK